MEAENTSASLITLSEKLALVEATLARAQNREASPSELSGAEALVREVATQIREYAETQQDP
jgi:hypothetical protein